MNSIFSRRATVRLFALAALALASSACCFHGDWGFHGWGHGHGGHGHGGHGHYRAVRVCR